MIFGVAGIPANYKGRFDKIFDWLRQMKLNAFEIQCTYGFKISEQNKAVFNKEIGRSYKRYCRSKPIFYRNLLLRGNDENRYCPRGSNYVRFARAGNACL